MHFFREELMKIVILDGFTENPGDLSWDGFRNLGELTVVRFTRHITMERSEESAYTTSTCSAYAEPI